MLMNRATSFPSARIWRNATLSEYSLKDVSKPIGVSEYRVTGILPEELCVSAQ